MPAVPERELAASGRGAGAAPRAWAALRASALPWALACAALVPFLGKAFTIDDPVFLAEARHALVDPLHPTAFEMALWDLPERLSTIVPPGPVMAWLLVPTILAGASEHVAHGTQLLLLLLGILATVSLALRLGLAPRWAAAAGAGLAVTPAVLGMAGTAMPDVPAMALGVAGLERLVAFHQDRRPHQGVIAAVCLGLAAMTRLHALCLLPVGLLLVVEDPLSLRAWRRLAVGVWAALAAAVALAVVIAVITRDPDPGPGAAPEALAILSSLANVGVNALSLSIHWVLAVPFALAWAALSRTSARAKAAAWAVATLGAAALLAVVHERPRWWLAPVAGLGAAAVVDAVRRALARRDRIDLALVAWMLIPLPTLPYAHLPPKYLVAAAPAAALLVARHAAGRRIGVPVAATVAALGLVLGIAILRADAAFAEVSRTGVRLLLRLHPPAGRTVWYDGHWAFQWYAEESGARRWSPRPPQPAPGDLILSNARRPLTLDREAFGGLVHLRRFEDRRPGGRVMDVGLGVGFYTNRWGHLPWGWGDDLIDAVDLWLAPGARPPAGPPGAPGPRGSP